MKSLVLAGLMAVLLVTACSGGAPTTPAAPAPTTVTPTPTPTSSPRPQPSGVTKVLTFVEENSRAVNALAEMPRLRVLAAAHGRATDYRSITHPSLPNYLVMAGGSTFDVRDDGSPALHRISSPSVFDVALAHGRTAKTYAEGMTKACLATTRSGRYAVKHNPWPYFSSAASREACARYDLPLGTVSAGALVADVRAGTLPTVGMVIPDLCHDAHDCSLFVADRWLDGWLRVVMAGPDYQAGRLAVVVTFDEVDGSGGGSVLTAVIHPSLRALLVRAPLDHLSWCRWMTDLVGAPPLDGCRRSASLGAAFGLPLPDSAL